MKISCFEEILAWQKGQDLAVFIYQKFKENKDFSFNDQICRAAVSVSNNIAEGYDRDSDSEFRRFLFIARGSNSEVKSMLYLSLRLGYLSKEDVDEGIALCKMTGSLINGFIGYLNKNSPKSQVN